ncbi:podoplanin [Lates japonicus]
MNVQLLLLLALVGPFCAFTHASPTVLPEAFTAEPHTDSSADVTAVETQATEVDLTVITATAAAAAPAEVTPPEAVTEVDVPSTTVYAEVEPTAETEGPVPATPGVVEPLVTSLPPVETAAPTEPPAQPEVTTAALEGEEMPNKDEEIVVEGLSSGQVVGIVIGALLAVVIVIAVVIAVVRRMGKYSP